MKYFISLIVFIGIALTARTAPVYAQEKEAGTAAVLVSSIAPASDSRVERLSAYLATHNSPLVSHAADFVKESDTYGIDWKLVAAIAGVESTFGKRIPTGSYNGWGWAVYTGRSYGTVFDSWEDGISTVSRGLREGYIDRGATTIEQIGRMYAASPRWAANVRFFMKKIEDFRPVKIELLDLVV